MRVVAVIPARYASTRFPGKPLAMLGSKPIIEHVWERVSSIAAVERTVVATDDKRIEQRVKEFGGDVMMTKTTHRSGTDRCGEVVERLMSEGERYDVVINVQGDEPFIEQSQIETLIKSFEKEDVAIATLRTRIEDSEQLLSANNVKVVTDRKDNALYFSRWAIPYRRGVATEGWLQEGAYYKHVGVYAFRSNILQEVCKLEEGILEKAESLEQLRWLEAGYKIAVKETPFCNVGIDTEEDLKEAEKILQQREK